MGYNRIRLAKLALLLLPPTVPGIAAYAQVHAAEPVDYVDPNIGGIGILLTPTLPYIQRPHGMARVVPTTPTSVKDHYLADHLTGFSVGPLSLLPVSQK